MRASWVLGALLLAACSQPVGLPAPRSGFADVNGARLYYEEFGSGRPVVLIHGGTLDRTMWDDQVPELARRYRVIRYDTRGFGRSSRAADRPFSAHDDLHGLLEHLRVEQADLVGLSLGGRIAIDYALTHPERVRSLVLAGPGMSGAPFDRAANPWVEDLMKAMASKDTIAAAEAWLKSDAMSPAMERADLRDRVRALNHANSGIFASPRNPEVALNPPAMGRLHELRVPILLIVGTRDAAPLRALADSIAAKAPNLKRFWIQNAGHLTNMEYPREFNRAVIAFLQERRR